jgi:hypothetical protein
VLLGLGIGKRSGELSVHLLLAKPRDKEDLKESNPIGEVEGGQDTVTTGATLARAREIQRRRIDVE